MVRSRFVLAILVMELVHAAPALAQTSGVQSLFVAPSIRASGMGRASAAVFWGGDPDYWANPALLGYHDGIRFDHGRTQLVPDLADDVYFDSDRFTIGHWGLGLTFSDSPVGNNRLDYGISHATDRQGHDLGTFSSWEEYSQFGFGVSLFTFAEALMLMNDRAATRISRYGDLAFGYSFKDAHVDLAPAWATEDGSPGTGDTSTRDRGFLLRLTPINSFGGSSLFPGLDELTTEVGGARLDLTYGHSTQNYNEAVIRYIEQDQSDPVFAVSRSAFAVRLAAGTPFSPSYRSHGWKRLLSESMTPVISLGWTHETLQNELPYYDEPSITQSGWELTIANVFSVRRGRIDDVSGDIIDDTWGWGLGFQLGRMGGVRYDRASVPQARGLDRVSRSGVTVFLDPWEVRRYLTRHHHRDELH